VWDTLVGLTLEGLAPDLTIVLKLDAFEGLERVWDRTVLARDTPFGAAPHLDRYERLSLDFHQRVIESFNAIAEASPGRCAILSGSAGQEDVAAQIRGLISTRLGARLPP
jgi:dTMP kinase